MARETETRATGCVAWVPQTRKKPGHYAYRLSLVDGRSPWIHCDPSARTPLVEARVREVAAERAKEALDKGLTRAHFGLKPGGRQAPPSRRAPAVAPGTTSTKTVASWFSAYYDHCDAGTVGRKNAGRAQVSAADRRRRFERWIEPEIGDLVMALVTPDDLRRVVRKIDEAIRERMLHYETTTPEQREERGGRAPGISAKFGKHLWGELTSAFREAATSKHDELRLRADVPTSLVQPPTGGTSRESPALYPSEVVALLSAPTEMVPLYRRALYAVALYTGARVGELRGLLADDVDLEHDCVNVRRQNRAGKGSARTKTAAGRRSIPIEPHLRPLLELLVEICPEGKPLLRVPPPEDCAELVRKDLIAAGCDREELFADDADRGPFVFHGLRHTCLTHWAVAQKPLPWLLAAAGHTNVAQTMAYIDEGAVLRGRFGEPHPPLTGELLAEVELSGLSRNGESVVIPAIPTGIERRLASS